MGVRSFWVLSACVWLSGSGLLQAQARTWTDVNQRKVEAVLVSSDGTNATLRLADGKEIPFPIARLSPADQEFVKEMADKTAASASIGLQAVPPPEKRAWPDIVEASRTSVEVKLIASAEKERKFVYRSEGFEFTSQANLLPGLMKSVAQTFEATKRLINVLPWGITCRPPPGDGFYQAALYETRGDYIAAGGPSNSGGVYMTRDKVFRIPFESLGVERRGQSYTRSEDYRADTLVHEITHQLMHEYLNHLPTWVVEGTAEYTEMLPYNGGKFRVSGAESGMKEYLEQFQRRGKMPALPELASFMRMPRSQWDQIASSGPGAMAELYQQSAVLVYFFNHLDGDGKGLGFMRFMDATREQMIKWAQYERGFDEYRKKMDEFFKLPGVTRLEGGRFSYPRGLKPPEPPKSPNGKPMDDETAMESIPVLLAERSMDALQQELVTKFAKVAKGLKVVPIGR